jgi:hypothetical protein
MQKELVIKIIASILLILSVLMAWEGFGATVPFGHIDSYIRDVCPLSAPEPFDGVVTSENSEPVGCKVLTKKIMSFQKNASALGNALLLASIVNLVLAGLLFYLGQKRSESKNA